MQENCINDVAKRLTNVQTQFSFVSQPTDVSIHATCFDLDEFYFRWLRYSFIEKGKDDYDFRLYTCLNYMVHIIWTISYQSRLYLTYIESYFIIRVPTQTLNCVINLVFTLPIILFGDKAMLLTDYLPSYLHQLQHETDCLLHFPNCYIFKQKQLL